MLTEFEETLFNLQSSQEKTGNQAIVISNVCN